MRESHGAVHCRAVLTLKSSSRTDEKLESSAICLPAKASPLIIHLILSRYRTHWDALLKSVRCEIISFTRNEQIDAYVLR